MQFWLNLPTRAKLLLAFGLMTVLSAMTSALAYRDVMQVQQSQRRLYEEDMRLAVDLLKLRNAINRERIALLLLCQPGQEFRIAQFETERAEAARVAARLHGMAAVAGPGQKDMQRMLDALGVYNVERDTTVLPAIRAGRLEQAAAALADRLYPKYDALRAIADQIGEEQLRQAEQRVRQTDARFARESLLFLAVNLAVVAVAAGLVVALLRAFAAPLVRATEAAQRIAAGEQVPTVLALPRKDEVGRLLQALDAMAASWSAVQRETADGVAALHAASGDILAGARLSAAGAQETAASVAETGAIVEEVKQTALLASEKARLLAATAQQASSMADAGTGELSGVMSGIEEVRQQMDAIGATIVRLSERSQAIGDIVATVGGLAEQSNLLAVNAAIEAAKAGESGRGFAVVAQQVRVLADQSREATRQVRLILGEVEKAIGGAVMIAEQSGKTVAREAEHAGRAGEAIARLAEQVREASQAGVQILASSQQQLAGMDQIALAMESITQASADHAAASRQAETAVETLHELGHRLKRMGERFRAH